MAMTPERLLADFIAALGNRYAIVRALGEGSYGRAFLARDAIRHVPVCVKLYHGGVAAPGADRDWHVTSTLKHAAIADTFTVEQFASLNAQCVAVVSRYIPGRNLERLFQRLEQAPQEQQASLSTRLL